MAGRLFNEFAVLPPLETNYFNVIRKVGRRSAHLFARGQEVPENLSDADDVVSHTAVLDRFSE